jgi:hypothetical protein
MNCTRLHEKLSKWVSYEIDVVELNPKLFQVHSEKSFPDGDGLVIKFRQSPLGEWEWTDLAHSLMHLTFWLEIDELLSGNQVQMDAILERHKMQNRDGELIYCSSLENLGKDFVEFVDGLEQIICLLDRPHLPSRFT